MRESKELQAITRAHQEFIQGRPIPNPIGVIDLMSRLIGLKIDENMYCYFHGREKQSVNWNTLTDQFSTSLITGIMLTYNEDSKKIEVHLHIIVQDCEKVHLKQYGIDLTK